MAETGDDVTIKFGANIDELKERIGLLSSFIQGFAQGMAAELRAAGSPLSELGQRFKDLGDEFADAGKKALGSFGPVVEATFAVFGKSATIWGLGLAAAGAATVKAANANAEMVESTRDLARALGITTNEASVMRAVFDDLGASQGEYEGAAKGLARQLRTNEDAMNRVGLVTRDASGNLRPLNELTLDAIKVLGEYKEGTDRNLVSRELFGRGIAASSRLMLINSEVIETNRAAVEELGLTVGDSAVKAWADYDAASDRASLTMHAFGKAIQESVIPVATELTEWFNSLAPAAIDVLRGAIGGLATAFLGLTNGVRVVFETINAMVITVAEPIRALSVAMGKALTGDFAGAAEEIKGIGSTIGGAWDNALQKIEASSEKTRERIGSIWAWTGGQEKGDSGSPQGDKNAPDIAAEKEAEKARLKAEEEAKRAAERAAKEAARAAKEAAIEQGKMATAKLGLAKAEHEAELAVQLEYLKQDQADLEDAYKNNLLTTREYYDQKLAIETKGIDLSIEEKRREQEAVQKQAQTPGIKESQKIQFAAEEAKILGQINLLETKRGGMVAANAAAYAAAEQQRVDALKNIEIGMTKGAGEADVAKEGQAIAQRRALMQASADEEIAAQAQLEARKYDIEKAALMSRMELARGNTQQQMEIAAQMEALEQQHQQRMTTISNEAERERMKYILQANTDIKGNFTTFLNDLMSGTKKISTAFHDFAVGVAQSIQRLVAQKLSDKIFDSLGGNKVVQMLVKPFDMAIDWIIGLFAQKEAMQTAATAAGTAERTAIEGAAEEESLLMMAAGAVKRIAMAAWEAAASVYASIAAIPYVGPFLAPAMAIAAGAVVLGFAKNVASAEGGWWQIPGDQIAQVHANEMVLPAQEAQGIRDVVNNANSSGRHMSPGKGGGGDTFVIHAADAKSFKRLLMDNAPAVGEAVRQHARNGGIGPKA